MNNSFQYLIFGLRKRSIARVYQNNTRNLIITKWCCITTNSYFVSSSTTLRYTTATTTTTVTTATTATVTTADCSLLSLVQVRSAPLRQMMTILIQVLANDD